MKPFSAGEISHACGRSSDVDLERDAKVRSPSVRSPWIPPRGSSRGGTTRSSSPPRSRSTPPAHGQRRQVCTREQSMDEVWDPHWFGPTKTLHVH